MLHDIGWSQVPPSDVRFRRPPANARIISYVSRIAELGRGSHLESWGQRFHHERVALMKAVLNGIVLADAPRDELIKIEGNWNFPPKSVDAALLLASAQP